MDPVAFVHQLLASTHAMVENTNGALTNKEVFYAHFFGNTGLDPCQIEPVFHDFYANQFPLLKSTSHATKLSHAMLTCAHEIGFGLVLATNPIFPAIAIKERMRWAEIDDIPFALVTTYEEMHYCKPQRAYYEEILNLIGAQPKDCLMVGNDPWEDLVAGQLGMKTYLVTDCLVERPEMATTPDYIGSLEELFSFVRSLGTKAVG